MNNVEMAEVSPVGQFITGAQGMSNQGMLYTGGCSNYGNFASMSKCFLGNNTGGGTTLGGSYMLTGLTFDGGSATHTVNPLVTGYADSAAGIVYVTAKNGSSSTPKIGTMMVSWVKVYGSANLQPYIIHINQHGMTTFTCSNNGANSLTIYTDSDCGITSSVVAGC